MPFTVTMPKLSPTMEVGTIAKWHKKEGDEVSAGDLLCEVATDKATVEYNALDDGFLRKIIAPEGTEAAVNAPIAVMTESADESIEGYASEGGASQAEETPAEEAAEARAEAEAAPTAAAVPAATGGGMAMPAFVPEPALEGYAMPTAAGMHGARVLASPLARKLAREHGIDLTTVRGSGPNHRVMSKDLDLTKGAAPIAFGTRKRPEYAAGSFEEETIPPIRKIVGKRLQESKTFIPHFYVTQTIRADALSATHLQLKNQGIKVSYNDFVIRAVSLALRQHPAINSGFNTVNNTIVRFKTIDIAVAVAMENGLITPIIRYADYKNLGDINSEMKALAKRARDGKLTREEYSGGSFTISNLGMYGVSEMIAVINPPQAAILGVGGMLDTAVVEDGKVVPGKTMSLTLSADHRVVDGSDAAKFLRTLKELLENPAILLVN